MLRMNPLIAQQRVFASIYKSPAFLPSSLTDSTSLFFLLIADQQGVYQAGV